jgi:hypothetical protein
MANIMPSSHAPSLALICPAFCEAFVQQPLRLPALERLVAYADAPVQVISPSRALDAWQYELLTTLAINNLDLYPSAPLTWIGGGNDAEPGTWLHAEPMLQFISAQGLAMTKARWTAVALAEVAALVRDHLAAEQMQWRVAGGRSYLQITAPISVHTVTAHQAVLDELQEALPTGPGAIIVRRAMNELQMLLHEKLNDSAAPNAIWLWGAGTMPHLPKKELPPMWTNDDYARGIYRAHAASERCAPLSTLDAMLNVSADCLFAMVREGSLEALEQQWFAPALRALERGQVQCVDLYLDGWQVHAKRSLMRRLFARSRSITEWMN